MTHFFSHSEEVQSIVKGLNLTKTLFVSSIIVGPPHTGKKTLAQSVFPNTPVISGENLDELKNTLVNADELIISDFEKIKNQSELNLTNKRIIATANYMGNASLIDELFAFIYTMPSLNDRNEDIDYFKEMFIKEAKETLMIDDLSIETDHIPLDLSLNNKSLKKSVYRYLLKHSMNAEDIVETLYSYLYKNLEGIDAYRENLSLFEKPLIEAGLEKYGSQLKLSEVLGINRNTLRKKIHEHGID